MPLAARHLVRASDARLVGIPFVEIAAVLCEGEPACCCSSVRSYNKRAAASAQLTPDEERPLDHCLHFSERDLTRQIFKTAVGCYDDLVCIDIWERSPNAVAIAGVSTVNGMGVVAAASRQ